MINQESYFHILRYPCPFHNKPSPESVAFRDAGVGISLITTSITAFLKTLHKPVLGKQCGLKGLLNVTGDASQL
jgi:hypothetical protein